MIVCVCHRVSSSKIQAYLDEGLSVEEISARTGLGTGCGQCVSYTAAMAAEHTAYRAAARPADTGVRLYVPE